LFYENQTQRSVTVKEEDEGDRAMMTTDEKRVLRWVEQTSRVGTCVLSDRRRTF